MDFTRLLAISLGAILVNNFILVQLLGVSPLLEGSKRMGSAVGMGCVVILFMGLASALCWPVNALLDVLKLGYMRPPAFVLVIAVLAALAELLLKNAPPVLRAVLGAHLPHIATNCAVLGVVLLSAQAHYGFIESVAFGLTGGVGFLLAMVLFAGIRERLAFADPPEAFRGVPIALVAAGLMALCFMGFAGMKIG